MRLPTLPIVNAVCLLASLSIVLSQTTTVTLPWANGDTVVENIQTLANGLLTTQTLQTLNGVVAGAAGVAATTTGKTTKTTLTPTT
jgi:hypothetical protein